MSDHTAGAGRDPTRAGQRSHERTLGVGEQRVSARDLVEQAADRLRAAEVPSPDNDARLLLTYVLGDGPSPWLYRVEITPDQARRFDQLIEQRARRIPLQHLTGRAYFGRIELAVGPGVFIPRPETEVMTSWASAELGERRARLGSRQVAVDLCTGSGAIAKSIALENLDADVHAVEVSPEAHAWAQRNLADTGVQLVLGDMANALPELDGTADLVVANPPYVPLDAYDSVAIEARDHDPGLALFSGPDGLEAIKVVVRTAARLLRVGGLLAFEHAEAQDGSAQQVVVDSQRFDQVRDRPDLTGRPRFVTAVRNGRALAGWDE